MASSVDLPPGWAVLRHERYGVEAYFHAVSRVCSWTRPYICPSDVETHEPPATLEDAAPLITALIDVQVKEAETAQATKTEQMSWASEEQLEAELLRGSSCVPYNQFAFQAVAYDVQKPHELPLALLRQYTASVFGARATFTVETAQGGHWKHPPHVARIELLGVTVATACHTQLPMCKGTAAENALLALCPHLYQEQLSKHNGGRRLLRPVITDPATLLELAIDDPRVFDLDLCLGKSPAQMLQARDHDCYHSSISLVLLWNLTAVLQARDVACIRCKRDVMAVASLPQTLLFYMPVYDPSHRSPHPTRPSRAAGLRDEAVGPHAGRHAGGARRAAAHEQAGLAVHLHRRHPSLRGNRRCVAAM